MLLSKHAIKRYFIFSPHLTIASALPGETVNPEIGSFHLNAACCFSSKHTKHIKLSPGHSWTHSSLSNVPERTLERTIASYSMLPWWSTFTKSVTVSLNCAKNGTCSLSSLEWIGLSADSVAKISYYLNKMLVAIKRVVDNNFVFQ